MLWFRTKHMVLGWAIMSKIFSVRPEFKETKMFCEPIVPAFTVVAQWYKDIPIVKDLKINPSGAVGTNIKHCTPFLEAMTAGYTLVLSDDILVEIENGFPKLSWRTHKTQVTEHSPDQYRGFAPPVGYHPHVFKWVNEFFIKLPDGYSLWCTHPVNQFQLPFQVISGFVDADSHPLSIQFPFFMQSDWTGIIESGTPLAQLIPVKRDSWKLQVEPVNEDLTAMSRREYASKIVRSYKNRYWHKKSYK